MSFNLRRRKASDGPNTWVARRDAAAEVIRAHQPDVVGTQEGLSDQVQFLLEALPEYGWRGTARMGGDLDEYNAVLYRKDRLRVLDSGDFWLSDTPDEPGSRSWGNYVPRMATWVHFQDKRTREPFWHFNTHFDHLIPRARKRAAELVASRLPHTNEHVLLTGDFNALPHGGTYRWLTRSNKGPRFVDSLRAAGERAPARWNATFHNFTGRGFYRIDYVFLQGRARVRSHHVLRDRHEGRLPSDHFPILAEVDLPLVA